MGQDSKKSAQVTKQAYQAKTGCRGSEGITLGAPLGPELGQPIPGAPGNPRHGIHILKCQVTPGARRAPPHSHRWAPQQRRREEQLLADGGVWHAGNMAEASEP